MLDIEDVISRIPDGVALLDEHVPDWVDKVDISILEMCSFSNCILGQLSDDYTYGREALGIPLGDGQWYGFDQHRVPENWKDLDAAWIKFINERRSA